MPAAGGHGERPVGRERPRQSGAGHHQHHQADRADLDHGEEHAGRVQGNGEDIRAGTEVLRWCARIGDIMNVALASY